MAEKRRIQKKDWLKVEQFISDTLDTRKACKYRKHHERIWKEVDRQVIMDPLSRYPRDGKSDDWRTALELGELSRASEVLSADIRRLSFPVNRSWFEVHSDIPPEMTEEGPVVDRDLLERVDGRTRALMTQQHLDFGLKSRVDLSVKEALHHGSYVVTAEWQNSMQVSEGAKVGGLSSTVWKPHSMWNCYPDPSASVLGHNAFYQGSMIITAYKPLYQIKKMVSPDPKYPFFNLNKIEETDKDIELVYFYGDIVIPRSQGRDLLFLNSRAMTANGKIIHYMPNPFNYPNVIYNGWERLDVRSPYYVSPLVKFSANQKIGSILASRFVDAVDIKTEPPIIYDGNDPDFVLNGGPEICPGAKIPSKNGANHSTIDVGDPGAALAGLQFIIGQIESGTKVDRVRSGVSPGTEQTATEVLKQSQNAELSIVDFVDKHETQGLRPFLYMQHDLNRRNLTSYPFYNHELDAPDFERMTKSDLPENVHFEIVGSKGVLGEEQRQQQTSAVTAFWMQANPGILNQVDLAKEMYQDAGNKNPEKFLKVSKEDQLLQQQFEEAVQQVQQEAQEQIASLQEQIDDLDEKLKKEVFNSERFKLDGEQKDVEKATKDVEIKSLREQIKLIKAEQGLAEAAASQIEDMREAVTALLQNVNAPKKVIFDDEGRPVGIEPQLQ